MLALLRPLLASFLVVPLASCSGGASSNGSSGTSLTGTYTGILQRSGGGTPYYADLAATVTVSESDFVELQFSSDAFPSFNAIVLSTGDTAVNLDLVDYSPGTGVQLQEVGFTKDSHGSWVLVIQTAAATDGGASAALVQFASYDPKDAPPASATLAVDYLDQMFAALSFGH